MTYLFDEDVIINIFQHYPEKVFPQLHNDLQALIDTGGMLCVDAMFNNLGTTDKKKTDAVSKFVEKNKKIFQKPTEEELIFIKEELLAGKNYRERLIRNQDVIASTSDIADPYLIAKAHTQGYTLVTDEGERKMPYVCREFKIKCINRINFFLEKDWKY